MNIEKCNLCPRGCNIDRSEKRGYCGEKSQIRISRAALHFGEEPCISGKEGSGTVFFTGCPLHCVFCQNEDISTAAQNKKNGIAANEVTAEELREIFFHLIDEGANNINLVTPSHFTDEIARALEGGLPVPVIWNSSGYEKVETLRKLDGLVSVYLPDFKYSSGLLAEEYSGALDYPEVCAAAIAEMIRQRGRVAFDERGMIRSGVIIRHLVLPGAGANTRGVIDAVSHFPSEAYIFSLLGQYTPRAGIEEKFPELARAITAREYENALEYLELSAVESYYTQELSAACNDFLPVFDGTGTNIKK